MSEAEAEAMLGVEGDQVPIGPFLLGLWHGPGCTSYKERAANLEHNTKFHGV